MREALWSAAARRRFVTLQIGMGRQQPEELRALIEDFVK